MKEKEAQSIIPEKHNVDLFESLILVKDVLDMAKLTRYPGVFENYLVQLFIIHQDDGRKLASQFVSIDEDERVKPMIFPEDLQDKICNICYHSFKEHGWLESVNQPVCPGDILIHKAGDPFYYRCKKEDFEKYFIVHE